MTRRDFDSDGDYAINSFITESPATIQAVATRLRLFRGEWFLNLESGIPWFQRVFVKPANLSRTERLIKDTISQTEGVGELLEFNMVFNAESRGTSVEFSASTIYNDEFEDVIGLNPTGA